MLERACSIVGQISCSHIKSSCYTKVLIIRLNIRCIPGLGSKRDNNLSIHPPPPALAETTYPEEVLDVPVVLPGQIFALQQVPDGVESLFHLAQRGKISAKGRGFFRKINSKKTVMRDKDKAKISNAPLWPRGSHCAIRLDRFFYFINHKFLHSVRK